MGVCCFSFILCNFTLFYKYTGTQKLDFTLSFFSCCGFLKLFSIPTTPSLLCDPYLCALNHQHFTTKEIVPPTPSFWSQFPGFEVWYSGELFFTLFLVDKCISLLCSIAAVMIDLLFTFSHKV